MSYCEFAQNSSEECLERSRNSNTLYSPVYVQISLSEEKSSTRIMVDLSKLSVSSPCQFELILNVPNSTHFCLIWLVLLILKRMVTHRFLLLSFGFSIFLEHLALFKNICREKIEIFRKCKPFKIRRKLQSLLLFLILFCNFEFEIWPTLEVFQ